MISFRVSAPGRVCLFGEHSDYLGLDVIAASIDMTIDIEATHREDNRIHITYLNLAEEDAFSLDSNIEYRKQRDYIRSAFNVMTRRGNKPDHGWNLRISGNIPIAAGLSSSSAMTVAAIMAISIMSNKNIAPEEIALAAYDAEVAEFDESGGIMDHYTSAVGGVIHVDMNERKVTQLPAKLDSIVIGDSGENKADTVGDLQYIRTTVEREYEKMSKKIDSFDQRTTPIERVYELQHRKPNKERAMAEASLRNRDLTNQALRLLSKKNPDPEELGRMLTEHHEILRDGLNRSTPKIERLITIAVEAGALGCKINGSGGGGTMMAYCSRHEREIASAIEQAGGKAYIVKVGSGASLTTIKE